MREPHQTYAYWARTLSLTTTAMLPLASEIQAQVSGEPLEEIVVTATRTSQSVFNSASTISVIDESSLNHATVPTLAEILRDVPGVQVSDSGQPGLGRIRVRGEESRRTAILVNNQELSDHHEVGTPLTLHPAMVERIEVVRGSGSVLYGSRALSGVVNFLTRKGGTRPLQATVSAGYDSATRGYSGFASLYGNLSGFEYRLAGSGSDYQNRQTPVGEMENTAFDNSNVYFYGGKGFGDHRLEYTFEDYRSSSNTYVEEEVKTTFPLTDFYVETPKRDRRKHALFYQWDPDNAWLKRFAANGFYQQGDRHFYTRTETAMFERDVNSYSTLDTRGALVQMDSQAIAGHNFIVGIQYLQDKIDQSRQVDTEAIIPPPPSGTVIIDDKASIDTWALFAQDEWEITNDLLLTAGLRHYQVEAELESSTRPGLAPGSLGDDDKTVGALGLSWGLNDNLRLRAHASQGYVYPSLLQLATGAYAGSSFVHPDPELKPETSVNYEIGMRYQGRATTLDTTVFYTTAENYIHHRPCTPADNCTGRRDRQYANIGESSAHGLELYYAYQHPDSGLQSYISVTWMQRRIDYASFSSWNSGVPALSGRTGLRWETPWGSHNNFWLDTYIRGESSSKLEEPDTVRSSVEHKSGWATVNSSMGVSFGSKGQYQFIVDLLNLGDKAYIPSAENLYGAERSIAARFNIDW